MKLALSRTKLALFCLIFTPLNASDLVTRASQLFAGKLHTFTTISKYKAVKEKTLSFPRGRKVAVLTDWDDTINGSNRIPGAWHQKKRDKSWVCAKSKRMLLEHEVDENLRDYESPSIIQDWREKNIPVIVTTARPTIIDAKLTTYAKNFEMHSNLMDARSPDNPDQIDYKLIGDTTFKIIKNLKDHELLLELSAKIEQMSRQSRIDLRGQPGIPANAIVKEFNGNILTYKDGYAFIGHTKGPNVLQLIKEIVPAPADLVIVDDNPKAIGSYLEPEVIDGFEKAGYTLHLMYYPVESSL